MNNITLLELKEYLYAHNEATAGRTTAEQREENLRRLLWIHRFDVITWLLHNGVAIPLQLLSDDVHVPPGEQSPDQPAPAFGVHAAAQPEFGTDNPAA